MVPLYGNKYFCFARDFIKLQWILTAINDAVVVNTRYSKMSKFVEVEIVWTIFVEVCFVKILFVGTVFFCIYNFITYNYWITKFLYIYDFRTYLLKDSKNNLFVCTMFFWIFEYTRTLIAIPIYIWTRFFTIKLTITFKWCMFC